MAAEHARSGYLQSSSRILTSPVGQVMAPAPPVRPGIQRAQEWNYEGWKELRARDKAGAP